MAHALKPEGGAGGALAGSRERATLAAIGEGEFELSRQIFSFHGKNYEGPPTTSDVVGGEKDEKSFPVISR